jgi:hypothetical protein
MLIPEPQNEGLEKKKSMPILEGHPNPSHRIHPFLPPQISRKHWNKCKYILATNGYFCHGKPCPTASPSPKQI